MHPQGDPFQDVLDEYISQVQFRRVSVTKPQQIEKSMTIILTGSTGFIGTHVLASLQKYSATQIKKIYCLNRSDNAREKQEASLRHRGLPSLQNNRVVFLKVNIGEAKFGLSEQLFEQLKDEATIIIHSAWPVNFAMPLEEFRSHLDGVRDWLHFSYLSTKHSPVLFVSSLGVAYCSDKHDITEDVFHDYTTLWGGYGQSKYIAERMVESYVLSTGMPAAVLRVGQIAGPVQTGGAWPHREWLPTLLRASKHIGALPSTLGPHNDLDWIPVDLLSRIVVEITDYMFMVLEHVHSLDPPQVKNVAVFNIANPSTVQWNDLIPYLTDVTANHIPPEDWMRLLEQSIATNSNAPGAKLFPFYDRIFTPGKLPIKTATHNLTAVSKTARTLPPVNRIWVTRWLEQWGYRASSRPRTAHL